MNLATTMLFYLLVGAAVAVAAHQMWHAADGRNRWFCSVTAMLFWPLYLPALLQQRGAVTTENHPAPAAAPIVDDLSLAIDQVATELKVALRSLDNWSAAALSREQARFDELHRAWNAQAAKIRELDHLLQQSHFTAPIADEAVHATEPALENASERSRRANIARLAEVRNQLHHDLINTLAWVRELVTKIHLAKYTGAPASRAEELVMQIANNVEGLSEVASWRNG